MLEETIKSNDLIRKEDLDILKGNLIKLLKSQNGSRVLQKSLQNTNSVVLVEIFQEMKNSLIELMVDSYANYFCQIFYSHLEIKQKITFLNIIKKELELIANSKIGTYPLQAIIDSFATKEEQLILQESILDNFIKLGNVNKC